MISHILFPAFKEETATMSPDEGKGEQ